MLQTSHKLLFDHSYTYQKATFWEVGNLKMQDCNNRTIFFSSTLSDAKSLIMCISCSDESRLAYFIEYNIEFKDNNA